MIADDDGLHRLELAGPLAPVAVLQGILDDLPALDPTARYLSGYISARKGEPGIHWHDLMQDPEWAAGWRAAALLRGLA
jgi:hypothetical protein